MALKRSLERLAATTAKAAWPAVKFYNAKFERPSAQPAWAPAPLLKRRERTFPQLGFPRQTDSLCPRCVKEVRTDILGGKRDLRELVDGRPGEIKAQIVEKEINGVNCVVMTKDCPTHGHFEDLMSMDPAFMRRL